MIDFILSIYYPEKDERTIRQNFLAELYKRDKDAIQNGKKNDFTFEEIWKKCLGAYDLDDIIQHVRKFAMEEEPELELVWDINDNRVRLTDRGRNLAEGL
jgi:hypothetical protein